MNECISSKQTTKSVRNTTTPSKRVIQNILNYSKAMQVKKTANYGIIFFMNN
jgi:hypothetical protein